MLELTPSYHFSNWQNVFENDNIGVGIGSSHVDSGWVYLHCISACLGLSLSSLLTQAPRGSGDGLCASILALDVGDADWVLGFWDGPGSYIVGIWGSNVLFLSVFQINKNNYIKTMGNHLAHLLGVTQVILMDSHDCGLGLKNGSNGNFTENCAFFLKTEGPSSLLGSQK